MPRLAYVNGRYVTHADAAVHVEDRGYQFADGVYEVVAIHRGRLVDGVGHMERLTRSLRELRIAWPMPRRALEMVMAELIRRNRIDDGMIYLQITRGVAPRDHPFPKRAQSSLVMTTRHGPRFVLQAQMRGIDVITIPDIRWKYCDIKSVSLLPNVLGKQQAREAGAYEAWMVDADGFVTEGTSTNAWIVTKANEMITRNVSHAILNGITRLALLKIASEEGVRFVERPFSVAEAKAAREAFLTSTTSFVKPVVRIDGAVIGDGGIGKLTRRLLDGYGAHMATIVRADQEVVRGEIRAKTRGAA